MRVRDIPNSAKSLTGVYNLLGGEVPPEFESALERDLITLTTLDPRIRSVHSQPLKAMFAEGDGDGHTVLDFLIEFHDWAREPDFLIEVKPKVILKADWAELRPKIRAGAKYAESMHYRYRVLTEVEIRTPFLTNAQFLAHTLQDAEPDPRRLVQLLDAVEELGPTTIADLLDHLDPEDWANYFPPLLHAIARMRVWADLSQPLDLNSLVRPQNQPDPRFLWGPAGPPLAKEAQLAAHLKQPKKASATLLSSSVRILDVSAGSKVSYKGHLCVVLKATSTETVLVRETASGITDMVPIKELVPYVDGEVVTKPAPDLQLIKAEDWDLALKKAEAIRPLLDRPRTFADVVACARQMEKSPYTIYDWIRAFENGGRKVTTFLVASPNGGRGKGRLSNPGLEKVINEVIEDTYLTTQKPNVAHVFEELKDRCRLLGLPEPKRSTFYNRIDWIPEDVVRRRRHGDKDADHAYRLDKGNFDEAMHPYHIIQIDHAQSDLEAVDPRTGRCIGRPWFTLAIDVYSRMVVGVYASMDPPSALSVGLCLSRAILSKKTWLEDMGVEAEWPGEGLPVIVHADNGKDFKCKTLRRACKEYGINIHWRPLKEPHFGGHIERLIGTTMHKIQCLPGTTGSSVQKRGTYDSAGNAIFSMDAQEAWIANWIAGVYHQREHKGLGGQCPLMRYKEGITGVRGRLRGHLGCGHRPRVLDQDADRFRLDFLPGDERKITAKGIAWDHMLYRCPELQPLRKLRDPQNPECPYEFTVRRDPRDISHVYLLNPETSTYLKIPCTIEGTPSIALWEWQDAIKALKEIYKGQINQDLINKTRMRLRAIQDQAVEETERARRKVFRRNRTEQLDIHGVTAAKAKLSMENPSVDGIEGASSGPNVTRLNTTTNSASRLKVPNQGWW